MNAATVVAIVIIGGVVFYLIRRHGELGLTPATGSGGLLPFLGTPENNQQAPGTRGHSGGLVPILPTDGQRQGNLERSNTRQVRAALTDWSPGNPGALVRIHQFPIRDGRFDAGNNDGIHSGIAISQGVVSLASLPRTDARGFISGGVSYVYSLDSLSYGMLDDPGQGRLRAQGKVGQVALFVGTDQTACAYDYTRNRFIPPGLLGPADFCIKGEHGRDTPWQALGTTYPSFARCQNANVVFITSGYVRAWRPPSEEARGIPFVQSHLHSRTFYTYSQAIERTGAPYTDSVLPSTSNHILHTAWRLFFTQRKNLMTLKWVVPDVL